MAGSLFHGERGTHPRWLYGCLLVVVLLPLLVWAGAQRATEGAQPVAEVLCDAVAERNEEAFLSCFASEKRIQAQRLWAILSALMNVQGDVQGCVLERRGFTVSSAGPKATASLLIQCAGGNIRVNLTLTGMGKSWRVEKAAICVH